MVKRNKRQEFLNAAMSSPEASKYKGLVEEEEPSKSEEKQPKGNTRQAITEFVTDTTSGALNLLTNLLPAEIDSTTLAAKVKEIAQSGDTTEIQEMLTSQALTLQAMFNYWVMVASKNKELDSIQAMAHLALKSQEQCRRTLQTLADVKSPKKPGQFIKNYVDKQLNHLQIDQQSKENFSETFSANQSNELDKQKQLEARNHAKMDFGSQRATSEISTNHETVGIE